MEVVSTSLKNGIFTVTLNRPDQLNALNWDLLNGLNQSMSLAEGDSSVRCIVIVGNGGHFMAGGDIGYFNELMVLDTATRTEKFRSLIVSVHEFVERVALHPAPVIASVRGAAAGFGISLVAGCDLAIASENSFFTSAYNFLGTSPDGGSTFYLPRIVGVKKTMELVLFSERINAASALEIGLVNKVVPDSELESATASYVQKIASSARLATQNAKMLVRSSFENSLRQQLERELTYFLECSATEDFREGVEAFVEKRKPQFQK